MRTDDFSRAPRIARAGAMFVGVTRCAGPLAWARHVAHHRTTVAALRRDGGCCAHRTFWQAPWTVGVVGWFDTMDDLLRLARTGAHRGLEDWALGRPGATGGWVRVYEAGPHGYSNGVWRAEGDVMATIEHFTPVRRETQGPPVVRRRREPEDAT